MQRPSPARLREETAKRLRRLNEAVGIFMSGLGNLKPSILSAEKSELVGFLGALNTGQELPLYHTSKFGFLASSASNTRATFYGDYFKLSEGVAGRRFGKSYSIKDYSEQTNCVMFDQLNLPADMIVTHSFTPVNTNMTISRIKRQVKQMQAADDAAVSLRENLLLLADDLEAKRASMGDHHMVVTVFAETREELESLGAEIVNAAASEGVTMVSDRFGANTHYFSQHPGNQPHKQRHPRAI